MVEKKQVDFSAIEKKWQEKWEKEKVFEAEIDRKKEKFFFTTPYPYISGSLHVGHGRAVTESDVYCRYLRMKGFNVLFPLGFHITGTPVLGISAAIKSNDKSKIQLYENYVSAYVKDKKKVKEIVDSFKEPQAIVDFFIPKMIEEYKQLGLGIDWRRSFTSGDMEHQQMVTWQFENYKDKNYLIQGKYPILYSPSDESAMGEDDIQDADINSVEKTEFTLLKFKFGKKFIVAATLRPETIYGQTNLWVNPNVKYIEAKVGNEIWIMSKECAEKLSYQRKDVKELGYTKEKLIGEYATAPMIERKLVILPSGFVDSDVGTGIVTSVPSDAPYDYVALSEFQDMKEIAKKKFGFNLKQIEEIEDIEVIPIIRTKKYGDEAAVKVVEEAQILVQDDSRLEKLTQEVYKEGFHNGIMLESCGEYAGIKVAEAKEKIKKKLLVEGKAELMYEPSRKAVSRSGGKIIVAVLDNQWFIDFNAKGWKDKAFKCLEKIELVPETNRKLFKDVFDWLDKRPCARKRGLGTPLPFDKSWIIESLSDSTIYMTLYTIQNIIRKNKLKRENLTGEFFDYVYLGEGDLNGVSKKTKVEEGVLKELRESFEYWMPMEHRHTFVLHLSNHLSFMIFAHAGLFPEKYWPKKITFHGLVISGGEKMSKSKGNIITLLDIKKNYGADVFRFYMTSSTNVDGVFDWREQEAKTAKLTIERLFDVMSEAVKNGKKGKVKAKYVSKFNKLIKNASEKINQMRYREYNGFVVHEMLNMVKEAKLELDKKEIGAFNNLIIEDWIKLVSPICPHIAEELWAKLGKKGFVSLSGWPKADESVIDEKLEEAEKTIERTVSDIFNVLRLVREKSKKETEKVYLYVLPNELKNYDENFLSRKTGKKVKVFAVNDKKKYDPEGKATKTKPGKPGIFVE